MEKTLTTVLTLYSDFDTTKAISLRYIEEVDKIPTARIYAKNLANKLAKLIQKQPKYKFYNLTFINASKVDISLSKLITLININDESYDFMLLSHLEYEAILKQLLTKPEYTSITPDKFTYIDLEDELSHKTDNQQYTTDDILVYYKEFKGKTMLNAPSSCIFDESLAKATVFRVGNNPMVKPIKMEVLKKAIELEPSLLKHPFAIYNFSYNYQNRFYAFFKEWNKNAELTGSDELIPFTLTRKPAKELTITGFSPEYTVAII